MNGKKVRTQKRYQFFGRNGIKWSNWFDYNGDTSNKIQLKSGKTILLNEYRTIEVDEDYYEKIRRH